MNFQATSGETALHLASVGKELSFLLHDDVIMTHHDLFPAEGIDESVSFLLNNGADVNARNSRGDTPLHYAIQQVSYFSSSTSSSASLFFFLKEERQEMFTIKKKTRTVLTSFLLLSSTLAFHRVMGFRELFRCF